MLGVVPDTTIRPRWWQWPTVLSLDAAVIAMAWQTLMAGALGVAIGWPAVFVLGSSVWLAYTCDRWIEAWRLGDRPLLTPRHRFHQRHRVALAAVAAFVLAADLGVAFTHLHRRDIVAGLILTAAVLAYLLSHQWVHRDAPWRAPKELVIAALLTAGVTIFLRSAPSTAALVRMGGLFALLCFTNCALISRWERAIDAVHDQTSLARRSARLAQAITWLPWLAVAASAMAVASVAGPAQVVAVCALVSSLLLALADRIEPSMGWAAARVLSDFALLTPLVPLLAWP